MLKNETVLTMRACAIYELEYFYRTLTSNISNDEIHVHSRRPAIIYQISMEILKRQYFALPAFIQEINDWVSPVNARTIYVEIVIVSTKSLNYFCWGKLIE